MIEKLVVIEKVKQNICNSILGKPPRLEMIRSNNSDVIFQFGDDKPKEVDFIREIITFNLQLREVVFTDMNLIIFQLKSKAAELLLSITKKLVFS